MHTIEPYYNWRDYYIASEDKLSPFYRRTYNEFEFNKSIYNYCIHPQWDEFGSPTLYLKVIYVNYELGFAIIELLGEWNDCINNDIMFLKREVIDAMIQQQVNKYILIGENVLNFHPSDDCYYEEWLQDVEDGWVVLLNFQEHVLQEMREIKLQHYFHFGEAFNCINWRTYHPVDLFFLIKNMLQEHLAITNNSPAVKK